MAQRRMFSKSITNSSRFLMMPQSSQNLYFHLGMNADDDGFCEHFTIMRMIESKPDDLKILHGKGFVNVFDDKVLIILEWKENNYIQKDRYSASKYLEIYKDEINLISSGRTPCIQDVYKTDTQVRVRLGEVREEEPVAEATTDYNFEEELLALKNSKRHDYNVIALYWRKKGYRWDNKIQFNEQLKRELKAAKFLKGYTGEQIGKSIIYCAEKYPDIYSLETVGKRIADLVNKK